MYTCNIFLILAMLEYASEVAMAIKTAVTIAPGVMV